MKYVLAVLAASCVATPSWGQYYGAPPPYYPPPPPYYPPPPPPPGYGPPGYPPPRLRIGDRCNAVLRTPYGPERLICPIEPRPLGEGCTCPAPRNAAYPGAPVGGRTIR